MASLRPRCSQAGLPALPRSRAASASALGALPLGLNGLEAGLLLEAAETRGITMTRDEAREAVYGEPFAQWKATHQREATPEQLAAFEAAKRSHVG